MPFLLEPLSAASRARQAFVHRFVPQALAASDPARQTPAYSPTPRRHKPSRQPGTPRRRRSAIAALRLSMSGTRSATPLVSVADPDSLLLVRPVLPCALSLWRSEERRVGKEGRSRWA